MTDEELRQSIEKKQKQLAELQKKLKAKEKKAADEKRKIDAHNKIKMGAAVMSVLGREYSEGDEDKLIAFLKSQDERGNYFSNAMKIEKTENVENEQAKQTPTWAQQ